MEKKKPSILYRGAFLSMKNAFLALAAVALAASLLALAFLDDIKLGDKTMRDIDLVTLSDGRIFCISNFFTNFIFYNKLCP